MLLPDERGEDPIPLPGSPRGLLGRRNVRRTNRVEPTASTSSSRRSDRRSIGLDRSAHRSV